MHDGDDHDRGSLREDTLFARFRDRKDARALASLFDAVAPSLLRLARHVASGEAAAEDLVQETFLAAIENPHGWRGEGSVFAWLVGVQGNLARAARRKAERRTPPGAGRDDVAADPQALAEHQELRATLTRVIATLPEPLVPVLKLHLDHQLSAKEIADALQRPAGTVRTQIVRGLELLRRLLPAGLAIGLLVRGPSRGIDAVRGVVVGAAQQAAGSGAGALAGWMVVGSWLGRGALLAVAALLAVGVTGWAAWRDDAGEITVPEARTRGALDPAAGFDPAGDARPEPQRTLCPAPEARVAEKIDRPVDPTTSGPAPRVAGPSTVCRLVVRVNGTAVVPGGDHAPLAGVHVRVHQPAGEDSELQPGRKVVEGETDSRGELRLDQLSSGRARVLVYPDATGRFPLATRAVELVAPESTEEIELQTKGRVDGYVVDEVGHPVGGAWIRLVRTVAATGQRVWRTAGRADARGHFSLPRLDAETRAAARAASHAPSLAYGLEDHERGPSLDIEVPSARGSLEIEARDRAGQPVKALRLSIEHPPQRWFSTRWSNGQVVEPALAIEVETGPTGRVRMDDVRVQELYVQARPSPGSYAAPLAVTARVGRTVLATVSVAAGAMARGVVRGEDGRPLANEVVGCEDGSGQRIDEVVTDTRGSFVLPNLPEGALLFYVGPRSSRRAERTMSLRAGTGVTVDFSRVR